MRIFITCIVLLLCNSFKAQDNQKLESEIISLYKVKDKDIQNCKKESEELRKNKFDETTIKTFEEACIACLEHLNFFRSNSLKMLEKTSNKEDFLIINFVNNNINIPFDTKTILCANKNYFGIEHYFDSENNMVIEKNEEFEVSELEIDIIEKINEYLRTVGQNISAIKVMDKLVCIEFGMLLQELMEKLE
ncbi:hypothetical protein [Chryseobacterium indologenes]|uniref:Uncharacterized protein n=1 Tax=Chryseobacterium indologenes TaxID=253 RepID=A0A0N0ITR3_CHRID|nr:hypothetical protein [Chryseobacterium indologenes]KPE48991.1 hypothetical protein AOB46_22435 [Chryseobacterium indologenes]